MIPIQIDTSDLSAEFSLTRDDVDDLLEFTVKEITKEYARAWSDTAKKNLRASRSAYMNAIRIDNRGRFTGVAYLDPTVWLANAVEMGISGFDMKKGLLNSPKAKQGKNGLYITIPFRFATPDSLGESSVFAGVMPTEVYKQTQAAEKTTPKTGLGLGEIPKQYQMPKSHSLRKKIKSVGFEKVKQGTQMTSKYEGLKRNNSGSGYVNFRRVSENSASSAFQHPGIQARDLAEKALADFKDTIPQIVDIAIDNYLVNLG